MFSIYHMDIIPEQRSRAILIKSQSDLNLEMYDIIDNLIDNIIDEIVFEEEKTNKLYKHVKIDYKLNMLTNFINLVYFCLMKYNILFYNKYFEVSSIACKVNNIYYNMIQNSFIVYDNCIQLNKKINIPYEYIKGIKRNHNVLFLELIPNEKNITIIKIESIKSSYIFNKIEKNMNYHVRFHKLNNKAIKYYQRFNRTPLKVY